MTIKRVPTPAGDMNWNQWRIATALVHTEGMNRTSLFLWNPSTGAFTWSRSWMA